MTLKSYARANKMAQWVEVFAYALSLIPRNPQVHTHTIKQIKTKFKKLKLKKIKPRLMC